jgi:hypothetical protein
MPSEPRKESPRTMLTFAAAAERLKQDGHVRSMSAEGLRKLARHHPEWPIPEGDYELVAGVRLVPYEQIVEFIGSRSTRSGRGPDAQPRKRPTPPAG